jgi:hypothetical protein
MRYNKYYKQFIEECEMMKFPYGISDFRSIMTDKYLYIDRTDRITQLEEAGRHLIFLRPRRFGKSLLLSMLFNYYDIAKADQFEMLFGNLAVGKMPTEKHNKYFVMKWDFSVVNPEGDLVDIKRSLHNNLNEYIKDVAIHYKEYLGNDVTIYPDDAIASFNSLILAVNRTPYNLYLLIDEYDNFANEIMMGGRRDDEERYKALLYGEGMLKTLFKSIKAAGTDRGLERVFITGVSPVVLSDITSGYNIAESISLYSQFNDLCGFCESEIETVLKQIAMECDFPLEEADKGLKMMRTFYNGYCFSYKKQPLVYNPTLAFYFMKSFQQNCEYPEQMLDENMAMDRGKITYISGLPHGEQVVMDALNDEQPLSVQRLAYKFGVADMLYAVKDNTFMASLLYYFGVLTMGDKTLTGKTILNIPNMVIKKLYIERIQEMLLPDFNSKRDAELAAEVFYQKGDIQPVCDFIETSYFKVFDNRDYRWTNELTIKTAFLTLLFNDGFYIMDSEPALNRDYADLIMILRPDMRKYQLLDLLMEFKYVSLKDAGLSAEQVKQLSKDELKSLAAVQQKLNESNAKLSGYRQALEETYGSDLRLYVFCVVSVGFERLVWKTY